MKFQITNVECISRCSSSEIDGISALFQLITLFDSLNIKDKHFADIVYHHSDGQPVTGWKTDRGNRSKWRKAHDSFC
jgi:hypothetical protein